MCFISLVSNVAMNKISFKEFEESVVLDLFRFFSENSNTCMCILVHLNWILFMRFLCVQSILYFWIIVFTAAFMSQVSLETYFLISIRDAANNYFNYC